jgi:hypothetical protein
MLIIDLFDKRSAESNAAITQNWAIFRSSKKKKNVGTVASQLGNRNAQA